MTHRTIPDGPVRVVLAGAGSMGRAWLKTITAAPDVELVAVADIDLGAARSATAAAGHPDLPVGADAVALAAATGAHAVVDATVPEAHHPVTTAALFAGLAEVTGELFMVSQSRRWNPQLFALRAMAEDLGAIGTLTTEFFRAPRFGGFREEMAHPLLVDMAIHPFDSARFVLGAEPVAAYCEAYNPSWSWYDGAAAATAVFEMEGGIRYIYNGSWCSPGSETSWNGVWRVSGEKGTARWDGDTEPVLDADVQAAGRSPSPYSDIAGALRVFAEALRTGSTPMGEVHENVLSLAMVEAAIRSADSRRRVLIDDVLEQAHEQALREETHADVHTALAGWTSVRTALTH
jgi:predicted dehydrogenase